jgi:hypothetical protein
VAKETATGKRIRSDLLVFTADPAAAASESVVGADIFIAEDDVRVVGLHMGAEVLALANGWDSGKCNIAMYLCRVAQWMHETSLMHIMAIVQAYECTVGAGVTETVLGPAYTEREQWFPEGYGIDLDEGESLNLNVVYANSMANPHRVTGWAIIYYVER